MRRFLLLDDLVAHYRRYAVQARLQLAVFEIEEVLTSWLEKIQAPATMRGTGRILDALYAWSQDVSVKRELERIFVLPSWFFPALGYRIHMRDPKSKSEFYDVKMGSGWCEENPFYAWLFRSSDYYDDLKSRTIQLLFIECYYNHLVDLTDPGLRTNSKTREQEVCRAARLLFDRTNRDFKGVIRHLAPEDLGCTEKLAFGIERYIKDKHTLIEQKNSNYLHSLIHFWLGDWVSGRRHSRTHQFKKMIARRYNRTRKCMLQGNEPYLQEILPSLQEAVDPEGLEPDDLYPQQLFIELDGECDQARDARELPQVERLFDPALLKRKSIDVTHKIRRGQNVSLQNSELIKPGDLARFIRFLQRSLSKENDEAKVVAFWAMLLIGKPLPELAQLQIFDDVGMTTAGLYLDPAGCGWWVFPVNYSAKPRLGDDDSGLFSTCSQVVTPCPPFFVNLIRQYYSGGLQPLLPVELTTEQLTERLKRYSDHLQQGGRISLDKLYSFIDRFSFATGCIDPVVLDFSYQLALSRTRVSRSYACIDDAFRLNALNHLWTEVTRYVRAADPNIEIPLLFEERQWAQPQWVGSTFTPTQAACQELALSLQNVLAEVKPSAICPLNEVIRYHNAYAVYTAFLLMFATGYRAVYNPLPSLALHLRDYKLLAISDKDDSDFTHARLVCMPELLAQQISHYRGHLSALAELLRCHEPALAVKIDGLLQRDEQFLALGVSDASQWYQIVRNSRRELGPLFHIKSVYQQWQPLNISPKALAGYFPSHLSLPGNVGRHWMKSRLLMRRVDPELIDWQMGHWMTGQAPLAYYSALSHVEVSRLLAPILDEMLQEVGWLALPSLIT